MTDQQKKYLKAAVISAISMAGVGAFVRDWRARERRKKKQNVENSGDSIVIPIVKSDFLRDVPTPEERSADMADKLAEATCVQGRKFDFFGKSAGEGNSEVSGHGNAHEDAGMPVNEKKVSEEKIDGRIVLRGQDGRFVSKTDPVAVIDDGSHTEKSAGMGFWDSVFHPIEFFKSTGSAAVKDPLWLTGGMLGSIYLAAKISEMINEKRKEKSRARAEASRDEYAKLLESGDDGLEEKKAESGLPEGAGMVLGTSFFVPMALTAMVANKIIENRDNEKKKQKQRSNSYPRDPTFLYHVIDGDGETKIAMAPDRALALMMFKTAMVASCEEQMIEKDAQIAGTLGDMALQYAANTTPGLIARSAAGSIPGVRIDNAEAQKRIMDILRSNDDALLGIVKKRIGGDVAGADRDLRSLITSKDPALAGRMYVSGYDSDPAKRNSLENSIYSSPALTDLMAERFTDEKRKDTFGAYADELIGKRMGLRNGSLLHKIIMWLMEMFGMKKSLIGGGISDYMREQRARIGEDGKQIAQERAARLKQENANAFAQQQSAQPQQVAVQQPAQQAQPNSPEQVRNTTAAQPVVQQAANTEGPLPSNNVPSTTASPTDQKDENPGPGDNGWKNPALTGFQSLIDSSFANPFSFFK